MHGTVAFLTQRLAQAFLVVWVVLTIVFTVTRISGDPVRLLAPVDATPAQIDAMRAREGLDRPVVVQYVRYLTDVARLDLGDSFRTGRPAIDEVRPRIWPTVQLGTIAILFSLLIGVSLGVLAALNRGGPLDIGFRLLALVGQAAPNFWLGLTLILLFSVKFHIFPTGGSGSWKHLVLPAITLGSFSAAAITRLMRSAMIDVLSSDYIRTARAKGLKGRTVVIRHALRNGMLPVVTVLGIQVGTVISGAIVVETVFAWPGMGRLMIQSISNSDYPVVQLAVLIVAATIVLANIVVDISYSRLDPRVKGA